MKAVLLGKSTSLKRRLEKEMLVASSKQAFEKAAQLRNQLFGLENVLAHNQALTAAPILRQILKTEKPIRRIEAYDVANIQGKEATGAMVVFVDDKPDKSLYRKFRIKSSNEPNDIAMLKEVLARRFLHSEWPKPQLVLVDGGKAQLNAALSLKAKNRKLKRVSFMALAKRNNELFVEGKKQSFRLKKLPRPVFNLVLRLRDEAHRFAQAYHFKLRKKKLFDQKNDSGTIK